MVLSLLQIAHAAYIGKRQGGNTSGGVRCLNRIEKVINQIDEGDRSVYTLFRQSLWHTDIRIWWVVIWGYLLLFFLVLILWLLRK